MRSLTWRGALCVGALACLLAPLPARAQQTAAGHDYQMWAALFATAEIAPGKLPYQLWFDGHSRRGADGTVVIVRPALGYAPAPWVSLWLGYAWVPVFPDAVDERVDEQRAWQQITLSGAWLDGTLTGQLRTRLEQRFHESPGASMGLRFREFARLNYRPSQDSLWGVALWDELFVGLNDPGFAPQGLDQNRVFVGPALYTLDNLRIEFGYLWVHLRRQGRGQNQHALAINFFVSL